MGDVELARLNAISSVQLRAGRGEVGAPLPLLSPARSAELGKTKKWTEQPLTNGMSNHSGSNSRVAKFNMETPRRSTPSQ